MRKEVFTNGEYYHIYNRGTDKRNIFDDKSDVWRFIKGLLVFNRIEPVGSLREELFERRIASNRSTGNYQELQEFVELGGLIEIVAICLNPNHFHILVRQISDDGVSKFMQRLGSGYTRYYNEKNLRNGVLFQGKFKAVHVESNSQLLHLSAYINLNDKIHGISGEDKKLIFSSWSEYCGKNKILNICKGKDVILDEFDNIEDYKKFVEEVARDAKEIKEKKRKEQKDIDRERKLNKKELLE